MYGLQGGQNWMAHALNHTKHHVDVQQIRGVPTLQLFVNNLIMSLCFGFHFGVFKCLCIIMDSWFIYQSCLFFTLFCEFHKYIYV